MASNFSLESSSDNESIFITEEPSQKNVANSNAQNKQDLELLMFTTSDSGNDSENMEPAECLNFEDKSGESANHEVAQAIEKYLPILEEISSDE